MVDNVHEYRHVGELMENAQIDLREWSPPGPKSLKYTQSEKLIRGMMGPVGSGKTTTMLLNEALCAVRAPRCRDGVRRYGFLCTRDSYRQLYKTCIRTWNRIFPQSVGDWQGGQDRPATHTIKMVDDYGPIELRAEFAAIPDGDIEDWFDGYETTSIIMNAITSHPEQVYTVGLQRIDRWPGVEMLMPGYENDAHIGFDMNKTDADHWTYETFVDGFNPDIMEILDFPSGLAPNAENAKNLSSKYYSNQLASLAKKPWLIKVKIHNQWGPSRDGAVVYPDFDEEKHITRGHNSGEPKDIDADPALPLCIGFDAGTEKGGRPSAVFFQVRAPWQVRVIDELYIGRCGPNRFGEALLAKLEEDHLRHASHNLRAWCDPSAFYGQDDEDDELTWLDIIEGKIDCEIEEPESNELENFRLETVRVLLNGYEEGRWMFQLSPRCKLLRKGFTSLYRYKRKEIRGVVVEDPTPEKNDVSHVHDALGHGTTGFFGKSLVENAGRTRESVERLQQSRGPVKLTSPDFDIFS